jgi:ketosteroid isomerase-like protein
VARLHRALARRDLKTLDRLLAEDFILTSPAGETEDKSDWLRAVGDIDRVDQDELVVKDVRIQVAGDKATATGVFPNNLELDEAGRVRAVSFTYSFERRRGNWQLVGVRTSP